MQPQYDDSGWKTGETKFGYGLGDETTVVSYGPDPQNKYITTYFRKTFQISDLSAYKYLSLDVKRRDGVVVYINGVEVTRQNLPEGPINFQTLAAPTEHGNVFFSQVVDVGKFLNSTNVIAAEVHQTSATSGVMGFDLKLTGHKWNGITRGPYLQSGTDHSIVIRWRTALPSAGAVCYGPDPGNLNLLAEGSQPVVDHQLTLSDLTPDSSYFYRLGSPAGIVSPPDVSMFFKTAPVPGTRQPVNIWAVGDSGTATPDAERVYQAYLANIGTGHTDVWLMLGDNAYPNGTDAQYQVGLFDMFPRLLEQTVLWPALGNHDVVSADVATQTGPYFDIFTLPRDGEAGGVPSGTEAYYSYNYANIHFVVLDSSLSSSVVDSPMLTWLKADLQANTSDWLIAYWHHPPYSAGRYDSDVVPELVQMRENVLPILEAHGVDLVLSGHSHDYERSKFISGFYGTSSEYSDSLYAIDAGSGRVNEGGAYQKKGPPPNGTVYVVMGDGGAINQLGTLDYPAMFISLRKLGSLKIRIDGLSLDASMIGADGTILDYFSIRK